MRSENYIIQLQIENQTLKIENNILDTALLNACQSICRSLYFNQEEIIKLKNKFIDRVRDNYAMIKIQEEVRKENLRANSCDDIAYLNFVMDEIIELEEVNKVKE
jgi:dihydroxyacetone kinase-like predicted kinase